MSLFDDPDYDNENEDYPKPVECKFCGRGKLTWEQDSDGKWLLAHVISGEVHKCKAKKPVKLDLDTIV